MHTLARVLWLAIGLVPWLAWGQTEARLRLPRPDQVSRIEISNASALHWYEPEALLQLLPQFVKSEGSYASKQPFQRGTFLLSDGSKIDWLANSTDSILLYDGSREQLYRLPNTPQENDLTAPRFVIWDEAGKAGFIDINGNIVPSEFDAIGEFSEGLAPVMIGDKWGYIDRAGKVVIPPRWKNHDGWLPAVGPFSEGLAAVNEYASWGVRDDSNYWTYKCGYIDRTGAYVIQPVLRQSCGPFSNGMAAIDIDFDGPEDTKSGGWTGYIDTTGKWVIKPRYVGGSAFKNGYAFVGEETKPDGSGYKTHLIDKQGNAVDGVGDCAWQQTFFGGLALAYNDKAKRYDHYINEKCETVLTLPPDVVAEHGTSEFSEGLALVYRTQTTTSSGSEETKNLWGYIDRTGKVVIPFQFEKAQSFSEGLAVVEIGDRESYIDRQGNVVIKMTAGSASPFKNGLAYQYLFTWTISEGPMGRNIRGYMNKAGKYVWLSPRAEIYLSKKWILENYVGPQKFNFRSSSD